MHIPAAPACITAFTLSFVIPPIANTYVYHLWESIPKILDISYFASYNLKEFLK